MAPFSLRHLDHVVLRSERAGELEAFYCEVLGCEVERRLDELGLVQLRAGSSLVDLVTVDSPLGVLGGAAPGEGGRNMDHLCLAVTPYDEDEIIAHLEAHGVRVGEVGRRNGAEGVGPSIYLWDPDGNMLELKGPPDGD